MAEKTVVIGGAEYTFRTPDGVAFIEEAELIDPNLKAPDARSLINKAARAESEHLLRLEFLRKTGATADRSPRSFAKFAARERGEAPPASARKSAAMKSMKKMAPKALATGIAAKMMLGGAAKAAAIPGIAEGLELMGREEPTAQEFYRGQGDAIAEALGLATGYAEPSPVYDPRREAAIRASLRSGREGLRPAPGETPVTAGEIEAYRRRR